MTKKTKTQTVTPMFENKMFGAMMDRECEVIREFWRNGEGWYKLRDKSTGEQFESPDVFWSEV